MSGVKVSQEVRKDVAPYNLVPGTVVSCGDNLYMIISDPNGHTNGRKEMKESYAVDLNTGCLSILESHEQVTVVEIRGKAVPVPKPNLRKYLSYDVVYCGEGE